MRITLGTYREIVSEYVSVKAQVETLKARLDSLASDVRNGHDVWGPIRATDTETIYVSESTVRRTLDHDATVSALRTAGLTDQQIDNLYKITPVRGSVRSRKSKPTDR
jgi:hypothetical protein